MTDRPSPEDDFNDLLEAAAAHRDAVTIDTFVRAPDQPAEAESVHDYADPYADLRARFSSHRVDEAGLDSMDAIRSSCFALGRTIELHVSPGPRRGAILDGLQQIMFAANHEIARAHSLGLWAAPAVITDDVTGEQSETAVRDMLITRLAQVFGIPEDA